MAWDHREDRRRACLIAGWSDAQRAEALVVMSVYAPVAFDRAAARIAADEARIRRCGRCKTAPVWQPDRADFCGRFCGECIDRCHEATWAGHTCAVCESHAGGGDAA